jgi:hypothetical protein
LIDTGSAAYAALMPKAALTATQTADSFTDSPALKAILSPHFSRNRWSGKGPVEFFDFVDRRPVCASF